MWGPLVVCQVPVGNLHAVCQALVQMLPVKHSIMVHGGPMETLTDDWCLQSKKVLKTVFKGPM